MSHHDVQMDVATIVSCTSECEKEHRWSDDIVLYFRITLQIATHRNEELDMHQCPPEKLIHQNEDSSRGGARVRFRAGLRLASTTYKLKNNASKVSRGTV